MEQLRKVVAVGCLTYVIYGVISWFQLGFFLPPLPVKPIIFLIFSIFGIYNALKYGIKLVDTLFFLWLIILSISNQYFLELFFASETIIYFQEFLEIYFLFIAVLLFLVFNILIIFSLSRFNSFYYFYFFILAALIVAIFTFPRYIGLEESSVIMWMLYFISNRISKSDFSVPIERIIVLLSGFAIIEILEWSVMLYSS